MLMALEGGIMLIALEEPLPETASERPPRRPRPQY